MIADVGDLGNATTKASGQELAWSPSSDVDAGQLVVLWVGWDGGQGLGEAADAHNARWSCRDDAGNYWSTVVFRTGGFNNAPGCGIFVSLLKNDLLTTDTVTVHCQITNRIAKVITGREFSVDPELRWAVISEGPSSSDQDSPNPIIDLVRGSPTPLAEQEYLALYGLAIRGPNTDDVDLDSDYTVHDVVGTSGGGDATNVQLHAAFRIATLDGDTVSATNNTTDRRHTNVLVMICEGIFEPIGPRTELYDDFDRADEDPLDGGLWETGGSIPTSNFEGRLVSNQAGSGGSWSLLTHDQICAEVWASFPVIEFPGPGTGYGLLLHGEGSGDTATRGGYEVETTPFPAGKQTDFDRHTFGGAANDTGVDPPRLVVWRPTRVQNGERLLLRAHNRIVSFQAYIDAEWEWMGSFYVSDPFASDEFSSGKVGYEMFDGTSRMDDFGQGEFPCLDWTPIIYRRQWEFRGRPITP